MPRLTRTIIPRIKKSIAERGILASILRSVLLPIHLFREHRDARAAAQERRCPDRKELPMPSTRSTEEGDPPG